jgi:hypothetical protein
MFDCPNHIPTDAKLDNGLFLREKPRVDPRTLDGLLDPTVAWVECLVAGEDSLRRRRELHEAILRWRTVIAAVIR